MNVVVTVEIPSFTAAFYQRVGESAGVTMAQVMSEMLTYAAGELSLEALHKKGIEPEDVRRMADERKDKEES